MKIILFVCTGNICRSPMAHYYMQKRVNDLNLEEKYAIDSAGTFAVTGEKSTNNAIEVTWYWPLYVWLRNNFNDCSKERYIVL